MDITLPSPLPSLICPECTEADAYAEHRAALEATVFVGTGLPEVVLVLENGRFEPGER